MADRRKTPTKPGAPKPKVNRISYLPSGIVSITPVWTAKGVELHMGYENGEVYIAVLTEEQAEVLYGLLRWHVEGEHVGRSPAS